MDSAVRFSVLGPVSVLVGPHPVRLRPKEAHVLGALLARAGRTVPAGILCEELWGDEGASPRTLNAMRVHLSHLRSALRRDGTALSRVVTTDRGYSVVINAGELDAANLGGAVVRVRSLAEQQPELALDCAREALGFWAGTPFGDLDSPLVNAKRRELEVLHGDLVLEFARLESMWAERPDRVRLRQLQGEQPTSEPLACAVALAEYRAGDQARALEVLQGFMDQLDEELGLVPTSQLRDLQQRILREEVGQVRSLPGVRTSSPDTPPDRADELAAAREVLAEDVGQVLVSGGRGLGKSLFLELSAAHHDHRLVVEGRRPGGAIAAACAFVQRQEQSPPAARGWAAGSPVDGSADPISVLVAQIARSSWGTGWPLLVVDDADELDADSATFVGRVLEQAGPAMRVLASAARPREALRLLFGDGVESWPGTQLVMRPLSIVGCAEALTRAGLPAGHPELSRLATRLHQRTGGHPFLVAATARDMVRVGQEDAVTGSAVEFVRRLRDGLAMRERRVLDRAVVDGPEFDLLAVASAAGMPPDEVVGVLEQLLLLGLVVDSGRVSVAPGFHELLLSAIGPGRPTLHLELATALSDRGRTHAERALGHLLAARELADVAVVARTAAVASGVAAENGRLARSIELSGLAVGAGQAAGLPDQVADWSVARVEVRYRAGQLAAGAAEAAELAARAEMAGDAELFARAAVLAATPAVPELRERSRAGQLLVRAAARGASLSRSRLVEVWEALTRTLVLDASPSAAAQVPLIDAALRAALAEGGDPVDTGLAHLGLRQVGVIEGQPAKHRLLSSAAAVDSLRGTRARLLLTAMQARASDAIETGGDVAGELLADYVDTALWMDDPYHHWLANRLGATRDELLGRPGGAQKHLAAARDVEELVDPAAVGLADLVQGFGRLWHGREWETLAEIMRSIDQPEEIYRPLLELAALAIGAECGDVPDEAAVLLAMGSLRLVSIHVPGYVFAALCAARLDEPSRRGLMSVCRPRLSPHLGAHVVLEGGLADLGLLDDLLGEKGLREGLCQD